jgi:hypothetical protein
MTFAWYAHLKNLSDRPWYIAAVLSWGIALFEYLLQVPANRIGYTTLTLLRGNSVTSVSRECKRGLDDRERGLSTACSFRVSPMVARDIV